MSRLRTARFLLEATNGGEMEHQDGYCDECGCKVNTVQLALDGRGICDACMAGHATPTKATRPEARDDGR